MHSSGLGALQLSALKPSEAVPLADALWDAMGERWFGQHDLFFSVLANVAMTFVTLPLRYPPLTIAVGECFSGELRRESRLGSISERKTAPGRATPGCAKRRVAVGENS